MLFMYVFMCMSEYIYMYTDRYVEESVAYNL